MLGYEYREQPTLLSGPATGKRSRRLLQGAQGTMWACRCRRKNRARYGGALSPCKSLNRVPPSGKTGDTRVRAAPYRLLSTANIVTTAQIDGRGRLGRGACKSVLGREAQ